MKVLDTHVWLWWITGDPRLSTTSRHAIEAESELAVATMSVWEVATLQRQRRLELVPDLKTWIARALGGSRIEPLALTPEIAATAGTLPDEFPGDPADRIVYATAVTTGAHLVTKDRRLRAHDPARTIW